MKSGRSGIPIESGIRVGFEVTEVASKSAGVFEAGGRCFPKSKQAEGPKLKNNPVSSILVLTYKETLSGLVITHENLPPP